jgi:hypothetical protein
LYSNVLMRDIHLMKTPVPAELSARGGFAIGEPYR